MMGTSIFIVALAVSAIYLFFKFLEMRFILKENKPLKILMRDTVLVYLSVVAAQFILDQLTPLKKLVGDPNVFTDSPDF